MGRKPRKAPADADQAPDIPSVESIAEGLMPLAVPISSLVHDQANARKHDQRNIDSIKGSLGLFGQLKPIVVRRKGMVVIAGNGTLTAAKELGWQKIAAVIVDHDTRKATAYGIADNRTAELARWDEKVLATLLGGMSDTPINMATLGFTPQDLQDIAGLLEPPAPTSESTQEINVDGMSMDCKCPKCGFEFNKDKDE